ncbi:protein LATERAL ROOT PRIMORDIUM 1-like [Juglans microcarpa x Juglans regia]|uniref:protein LATERAL ROOT PRIMORDIUM 1-like n=1 Tax=Juglans microcarpa x Juglans regia TaxID=2249226 RepID=UPI001B7E9271|nr:protein LATERAL ROOT PRIMORDIUM 1-like [Juglans microcarpa x Juglans regia]
MTMLGLGDLVLIAPNTSMHQQNQYISADHNSNLSIPSSAALGLGFGIFPLLTTTPCITAPNSNNPNYWSVEKGQELSFSNNFVNGCSELMVTSIESGMRVCGDCGNKAKKDCSYMMCRTCCKSRGYDCATHVRSTWVPAARRRERGLSMVGGDEGDGSSGSSSGVKRSRIEVLPPDITISHASTCNPTTQRSTGISSSHQDASFKRSLPRQVRAKAVFRCHKVVTAVGKGEAECVYQATVSISGHLFKGFLYDQGVEDKNSFACISQMQLESSSGGRNGKSSSIVSPSNAHPGSAN